ncbi:aspartyl/asparaginyl beta-hydroxylase domain-containing protein [Pseudonocardia alni]|uniref:Aspartate beta-hydroxylase n=1 Tax=Pseudonocardia alni TaxID=33907 RepID=A0A852W8S7_PSEA5|nr:aspartyl/asparaginyl beta-hydroxylase domain-containing protein [Pseudonocardia antarctica]NYG05403.1 aspartate beta-hydroxylase [Pseudonocardia antarctica]
MTAVAARFGGVEKLAAWASDHDVERRELDRVFDALTREEPSQEAGPLQKPAVFVEGLTSRPWHDRADHPWTAALEAEYPRIRAEFNRHFDNANLPQHPESVALAATGKWNTFHFYKMGQEFAANLAACPAVATALAEVPGIKSAGMAYFSVMGPGTVVRPHCGFVNTRIRVHLGLVVPPDCQMRVGAEFRPWTEGSCSVFDDSYEHEVYNRSDHPRAVLLLDAWHPGLTAVERRAMAYLMHVWRDRVD